MLRFGDREVLRRPQKQAGVDGVLIIDMIVEEAGEYLVHLRKHHLAPIFLAAPTSPDERLRRIAEVSQGFVYAISRTGITGTQKTLANDAEALVQRLRRYTKLPIAVGFGVSTPEHVAAVGEFADAAVVGSALVAIIEKSSARRGSQLHRAIYQGSARRPTRGPGPRRGGCADPLTPFLARA